jgi:putative transcriptional regulator
MVTRLRRQWQREIEQPFAGGIDQCLCGIELRAFPRASGRAGKFFWKVQSERTLQDTTRLASCGADPQMERVVQAPTEERNVSMEETIKTIRTTLSLNQVEFAAIVGVHPITISKWERGIVRPSPYQLALIHRFEREPGDFRTINLKNVLASEGPIGALALLLGT